jgi:glutaredoxin
VEEQEVQDELEKLTGQRTVPNVFIGAWGSSTRCAWLVRWSGSCLTQ